MGKIKIFEWWFITRFSVFVHNKLFPRFCRHSSLVANWTLTPILETIFAGRLRKMAISFYDCKKKRVLYKPLLEWPLWVKLMSSLFFFTRYQERFFVKGHVQKLMFHRFPRNEEKRKTWTSLISKGRSGFTLSDGSKICSNHLKTDNQLQRIQIQRCG